MHRQVGAPVEHRLLHLLGEHALPPDRVERHPARLGSIAVGLDQDEFDLVTVLAELIRHGLGLGDRLRTPPRRDADRGHRPDPGASAQVEQVGDGRCVAFATR